MENSINTPVLFITFARPDYARKAFDQIKIAKPKNLYFYSNGARKDKPKEIKNNIEIRSYIEEIDWDCNLRTYFREEYVEMVESHEGAYGWVFKYEDRLIEIDEDCIASIAFFDYCEKLLERYKDEKRVWMISGDNFTPKYFKGENSFFFSRYGHTYGWATWKDRWYNFDRQVDDWEGFLNSKDFINYYTQKKDAIFHSKRFANYFKYSYPNHPIWDFLFFYKIVKSNGLCILPKYNLVRNIGIHGDHNPGTKFYFHSLNILDQKSYPFSENYPNIEADNYYDWKHFTNHWLKTSRKSGLFKRFIRKLRNYKTKSFKI